MISQVAESVSWKLEGVVQMAELMEVKEHGMMKKGHSWEVMEEERQLMTPALPPVLQLALRDFGRRHS